MSNLNDNEEGKWKGTWIANIFFCCVLAVAGTIQLVVKEDLKREYESHRED